MQEQERYWHWLCCCLFPDRLLMGRLAERIGTPKDIFETDREELLNEFPENREKLLILCLGREGWNFEAEEKELKRKGIRFLSCEHPEFPRRLQKIPDGPKGIFYVGGLPEEDQPSLAIVGARNCSAYGRNLALQFGEELGRSGVQIVSGMARGVDGFSHRGALKGGENLCGPGRRSGYLLSQGEPGHL